MQLEFNDSATTDDLIADLVGGEALPVFHDVSKSSIKYFPSIYILSVNKKILCNSLYYIDL